MLPLHLHSLLKDSKINCRIVADNARRPVESVTESSHHQRSVPLPRFPPTHKRVAQKKKLSMPQRNENTWIPPPSRWDSNPVGDVTPRTPSKPPRRKKFIRQRSNRDVRPPQRPALPRLHSDSCIRIPVRKESYDDYHTAQLISKALDEADIYDDNDDSTLCTTTTETLTEDSSICSMGRSIWWTPILNCTYQPFYWAMLYKWIRGAQRNQRRLTMASWSRFVLWP